MLKDDVRHVNGGRGFIDRHRDFMAVLGFALALRVLFLLLTADTYDYDEFVLLTLARDWAHGAMPYRDFMFFHPPGALAVLRLIEPATAVWWPAARLLSILIDVSTACIVFKLGTLLWDRRGALASGLIYSLSPLAMVSAVRVGQDPMITMLGMGGLLALLSGRTWRWAIVAGVCLGAGVWIKYPALYFVPIYVLAAPRLAIVVLPAAMASLIACGVPFSGNLQAVWDQTVVFQRTRYLMEGSTRLWTTLFWWLGINPLAVVGIFRRLAPLWLTAAFLLGGLFGFNSQVYYHYFVPVVPFACLLAGPIVARLRRRAAAALAAIGVALAIVWGMALDNAGEAPLFVTAAHLSRVAPVVTLLRNDTPAGSTILADRYEYAYLSNRQALAHYFWNIGVLVDPYYLERRLSQAAAAVQSSGASSGFPARVTGELDRTMVRVHVGSTAVWTRMLR
jgi:Dolichyl-phosphate-mannose-protein mannosyltransferase